MLTEFRNPPGYMRLGCVTTDQAHIGPAPVSGGTLIVPDKPWSDALYTGLIHSSENVSVPFDVLGLIGHAPDGSSQQTKHSFFGFLPRKAAPPAFYRVADTAGFASNLKSFVSDWDFQPVVKHVPGENPVVHTNIGGFVNSGSAANQLLRHPDTYVGPSPTVWAYIQSGVPYPVINGFSTIGTRGHLDTLLRSWLPTSSSWDFVGDGWSWYWRKYANVAWKTDDLHVSDLEYHIQLQTFNPAVGMPSSSPFISTTWHVAWQWWLEYVPGYVDFNVNFPWYNFLHYWHTTKWSLISYSLRDGYDEPVQSGGTDVVAGEFQHSYSNWDWVVLSSLPSDGRFHEMVGVNGEGYVPTGTHGLLDYQVKATETASLSYAAGFLAAKDAIDTHFEALGQNNIEFALELRDLASPIDTVKAALTLARGVRKGHLKFLPFLLRYVDILTDAYFVYSLAIAPTVSAADETARRAKAIQTKLLAGAAFGSNTVHGKFSYEFTPEEANPFDGMYLTTRATMRIHVPYDSLLTAILPVRSLGLLPSLSTIWDLLPWSFVVDWATKTGKSLELIDDTILFHMIDVEYTTVTMKIGWPFNDDVKREYDFDVAQGSNGVTTEYRLFWRYVLAGTIPPVLPCPYPFLGTANVPDWALASSLVYKILT